MQEIRSNSALYAGDIRRDDWFMRTYNYDEQLQMSDERVIDLYVAKFEKDKEYGGPIELKAAS